MKLFRRCVCFILVTFGTVLPAFADTAFSLNQGGKSAADFLPKGIVFDPTIPTPEAFLHAKVGTWHVRPEQLTAYMYELARVSDRISIEETGRTHENRPLLLLTITSPKHHQQVDALRTAHIARINSGERAGNDAPLVLYMGYSIHGNEPSGSNAALVIAYYLAAAQSDAIDELLDNTVILLDPSLNPDGLARFAQWANGHKGSQLVADPNHREHKEGWPNGRTNHYWFDLNRDWLLLTHPESRARIAQFQKWRPHILTDFHEMGTNSTYFFQPGIPTRKHPLTPDGNVVLTEALAEEHINAFDQDKLLYFSEESFDDFYFGKGSTYPDAHGSVGILFEQASSRGHLQDSINGQLSFVQTIQNQVTISLSTFKGALANERAFHDYQVKFREGVKNAIKRDKEFGYVIARESDLNKQQALTGILDQHHITYEFLTQEYEGERDYSIGSLFIPLNQAQYRLVKSLFSTQTSFVDNTFYDVSNWNIGLAFNLDYEVVPSNKKRQIDTQNSQSGVVMTEVNISANAYAYIFSWEDYNAPALLEYLLARDVTVKAASEEFIIRTQSGDQRYAAGAVMIPMGLHQPEQLEHYISEGASALGVNVAAALTGHTSVGPDLGSAKFIKLTQPRVLIVGGQGTNVYEVGEIWHHFDTRVGLPVSIVDMSQLGQVDLTDYSHVIMASGRYGDLSASVVEQLQSWLRRGGTLVAQKAALRFVEQHELANIHVLSANYIDNAFSTGGLKYADRAKLASQKRVAGAVFEVQIDDTHPLFFGLPSRNLPVFKTSSMLVEGDDSPFSDLGVYTNSPLMAGFASTEIQRLTGNKLAMNVSRYGRGKVISLVDNMVFRGYWRGTDKVLTNAVMLSPMM